MQDISAPKSAWHAELSQELSHEQRFAGFEAQAAHALESVLQVLR